MYVQCRVIIKSALGACYSCLILTRPSGSTSNGASPPRWNDLIPRRFRCWNDHHGAFIKLNVKEGIDWSARREWFFRSVITRDSMGLESAIKDQFWKVIGKITIDIQFVVGRRGKSRGYRVPNHHRVRNIASTEGNSGVVTTRL